MTYHLTSVKKDIIKSQQIINISKNMEKWERSFPVGSAT